jgi:hypothetical protein
MRMYSDTQQTTFSITLNENQHTTYRDLLEYVIMSVVYSECYLRGVVLIMLSFYCDVSLRLSVIVLRVIYRECCLY